MDASPSPRAILKSHFGYDSFLPLQEEIVGNVLAGRDSLVLMPTGGGKSLCYQLPALCRDGLTLVVSPLIALMKDQVDTLQANGIAARFINSSLTASEIDLVQAQARRGLVKILYVAPERLAASGFRRFLQDINLSLIAIDEAHCISEWGHEFRPDYRNLRQLRQDFPATPLIALTATATERVRQDIIEQLALQRGQVFLSSFNRANLTYSVQTREGYWPKLLSLLQSHRGQSVIIYCISRRETEELAEDLNDRGLLARPYHAGLSPEERRQTQEDFIRDRVPVIVATIAFGMGIDKPDIRLVVHFGMPKSVEGYYQETGRAGRDGLPGECILFYAYSDKARQDYFIDRMEDAAEQAHARQKLSQMVGYAQLPSCRRRYILQYFGEQWREENCGSCDICLAANDQFDATELAQKTLSAVIRTGERFGAAYVSAVLRGSRMKRILELGHDRLSVYGIAADYSSAQLREVIGHLQVKGLLARNEGEFATLSVTAQGRDFLRQRQRLSLPRLRSGIEEVEADRAEAKLLLDAGYHQALFEELRALRRQLADAKNVPAFVVFGDVSLRHMAAFLPQSLENFASVPGVGAAKLEEYGEAFLKVIRNYASHNGLADYTGERPATPARQRIAPQIEPDADKNPERRRKPSYDQTRELLSQGLSISQIARQHGLKETTVLARLERLSAQGVRLSLPHLLPPPERLAQIRKAIDVCGAEFLRPVREYLGAEFTYEELRIARIYLRQEAAERRQHGVNADSPGAVK